MADEETPINLTTEIFTKLNLILSDFNAYLGTAPFTAAYPVVTFNMIASSTVDTVSPAFGDETESFRIQVSIFDDQEDCVRLIQTQAEIEEALKAGDWGDCKVRVKRLGSYGPVYIDQEKYWQFSKDYEITLCKEG
jgi:hypothetical protein